MCERERQVTRVRKLKYGDMNQEPYADPSTPRLLSALAKDWTSRNTIQYNTTLLSLCREICFLAPHHQQATTNTTATTNTRLYKRPVQFLNGCCCNYSKMPPLNRSKSRAAHTIMNLFPGPWLYIIQELAQRLRVLWQNSVACALRHI